MTSSKTSSAPLAVAPSRSSSRKPVLRAGRGPCWPGRARTGSRRTRARPAPPATASGSFHGTMIVFAVAAAGTPGDAGSAAVARPGAGLGQQAVDVPVVGAGELQQLLAAGRGAREADRAHRRLGPARGHAQHVDGRDARGDRLGQQRPRARSARRTSSRPRGLRDRRDDRRVRVAVDQRAPRADVVDVAVAVDVGDLGALGALDEDRVAPDRAHRAHRASSPRRGGPSPRARTASADRVSVSEAVKRRRTRAPTPGTRP